MKLTVLLQLCWLKQNKINLIVLWQSSSNMMRLEPSAETIALWALNGRCQIFLNAPRHVVQTPFISGCDRFQVTEPYKLEHSLYKCTHICKVTGLPILRMDLASWCLPTPGAPTILKYNTQTHKDWELDAKPPNHLVTLSWSIFWYNIKEISVWEWFCGTWEFRWLHEWQNQEKVENN